MRVTPYQSGVGICPSDPSVTLPALELHFFAQAPNGDCGLAGQSACSRNVDSQDGEAQRRHPKPQYGQETRGATEDEGGSQRDSGGARTRQVFPR